MTIIAVDDEPLALLDLKETLLEAAPDCRPFCFTSPKMAVEYAEKNRAEVALLDIEMGPWDGFRLALELKALQPDMRIVFVTSHEKYAIDAFRIHATGYLLKPVASEAIKRELTFIYGENLQHRGKRVRIQTFGGFDVFVDGERLNFKRAKAKELLACLVDRKGVSITTREACAILWEDKPYNSAQKSYYQTIAAELKAALRGVGADNILVKTRNSLAIRPEHLDCDSYRFMEGDPSSISSYRQNYMSCYSWAEFSIGQLERR